MKRLALVLLLAVSTGGSFAQAQVPYVSSSPGQGRMTVRGHGGPPAPDGSPILYDVSLELAGGYAIRADEALRGANGNELLLRGNVRLTLAR